MKPPFEITPEILNLIGDISLILGKLQGLTLSQPEPKLRKKNRIRTIKSTLAIEGNTFTEEQITAILEKKKVLGTKKEILEVQNAINVYEELESYKFFVVKDFLKAHGKLMQGLIESSGKFRVKNVGVMKGQKVKHVAPKPSMVSELVASLFDWGKTEKKLHPLIKSSIVHYEIEFIHPFEDGNGCIGRLWQTVILSKFNPIFKFVPIESLIEKKQMGYYEALETSDRQGTSTPFIEFILSVILEALKEFDSELVGIVATSDDRITKAKDYFGKKAFSRKDYMELFKSISSATASRDLRNGVKSKRLEISGEKNQTRYKII